MLNVFLSRFRWRSRAPGRPSQPPQESHCTAVAVVPQATPAINEYDITSITPEDIKKATACGQGGFGVVLRLNHPLGELALKRLKVTSNGRQKDPEARRALREAETWKALKHFNILPFLGVIETPDDMYLVSPYMMNGSLTKYLREHPRVSRRPLLADTAAGIEFLHESKIIHGDIKGSNVLVSNGIRAVLCDFGLSRHVNDSTSAGLRGSGAIRWQSPELMERGAGKTTESDLWAFGMTIYEILSGNIPFYDYIISSAVTVALVVRDERPSTHPTQSSTGESYDLFWKVARHCWRKNPARRPLIGEVRCQLDQSNV